MATPLRFCHELEKKQLHFSTCSVAIPLRFFHQQEKTLLLGKNASVAVALDLTSKLSVRLFIAKKRIRMSE